MKFHELPMRYRMKQMGDKAEEAFIAYCERMSIPYVRMGFNRPPFSVKTFKRIPKIIRHTPDFVAEFSDDTPYFVECKGYGRYNLKVKDETLVSLQEW